MPDPFQCRCGHRLPSEMFAGGMAAWCPACGWPVAPPAGPVVARRVAKPLDLPPPVLPHSPPPSRRLRVRGDAPIRPERDSRDEADDLPRRPRPAGRSLWQPEYARPLMIGGTVLFVLGAVLVGVLIYVLDPFSKKPDASPPVAVAPPSRPPAVPPPPVTKASPPENKPVQPGSDWPGAARSPQSPPSRRPDQLLPGDWKSDTGDVLVFTADGYFRGEFGGTVVRGRWAAVGFGPDRASLNLTPEGAGPVVATVTFAGDDQFRYDAAALPGAGPVQARFARTASPTTAGPRAPPAVAPPPPPGLSPPDAWPVRWSDRPPAELLMGVTWEVDLGGMPRFKHETWTGATLRFGADGRYEFRRPGREFRGRYTITQINGKTVHYRLTADAAKQQPRADYRFTVTFLSDHHLEYSLGVPLDSTDQEYAHFRRPGAVSVAGPE